jgi:multiple sugar transport system substrate-binding protein
MRSQLYLGLLGATGAILAASNPTLAWTLEEAAAPYKGTELTFMCEGYSPCLAYKEMAPEFEKLTGIKVKFEVGDLLQITQQALTDALTETQVYDAVQVNTFSIGAWAGKGFAEPIEPLLANEKLHDPNFKLEDFIPASVTMTSSYQGKLYGIPYSYIPPFAIYRKDIAADPSEQAAFKAKYGYDSPFTGEKFITVDTWEQWRDAAEFFTRKKGEKLAGSSLDRDFYGVTTAFKRHYTALYDYERILLGMGGEIVDANGNIKLSTPEAKKALEYMLSLRPFAPPSYREYTWDEQYSDFCAGNLFSTFTWGDTTPFLESEKDCPTSTGKLGYFVHPGTHKTPAEGHSWVISAKSSKKEPSFLFVQYMMSKEQQIKCQATGCATPRRDVVALKDWESDGRMVIHSQLLEAGTLYGRPALPQFLAIQEILMEELSAVGADQQSIDDALKDMTERSQQAMSH